MGCSQSQTHQENLLQAKEKELTQNLKQRFVLLQQLKNKLKVLSFTTTEQRDIIQLVLTTIQNIQSEQTETQKSIIKSIFSNQQILKLSYQQTLRIFKNKNNQKVNIKNQIRIYYDLANLKKSKQIKNQLYLNEKIQFCDTYSYNRLSEQEIDQIIILQAVGEHIQQLGKRIFFKYNSMIKKSHSFFQMLSHIIEKEHKSIHKLRYDLSFSQCEYISRISKEACQFYDDGVFFLLAYLKKSCKKLEEQGKTTSYIADTMTSVINKIFKLYPPGVGLSSQLNYLQERLKSIEYKDKFTYTHEKLESKNKQVQLENIILKYAKIANKYQPFFEELVKQSCLDLCIMVKIGLKINPNNPNVKSITRVKEKLLFNKNAVVKKRVKQTIKATLLSEDIDYKKQIDELLSKKQSIEFKISDMVRGKCVFLDIHDILEAVDKIIAFVHQDKMKRFRMIEIESRFTNSVPISDITLKIAIKQQIVAELQLTIQSNAATYNFSHRVYELQRTKVFSKLKIVHDYFEQFQQDFKDMTLRTLNLSKQSMEYSHNIISKNEQIILSLLDFTQLRIQDFQDALTILLTKQNNLNSKISINQRFQKFMITLFNKQMGQWYDTIGTQIDQILKSEADQLLKSTLLYFFFRSFDISKQINKMVQFRPIYKEIRDEKQFGNEQTEAGKDFTYFYLKKVFNIDHSFDYSQNTAKLFYESKQIQNIRLKRGILLKVDPIIKNQIIDDKQQESITFMVHSLWSFFHLRSQNINNLEDFQHYYDYLKKRLKTMNGMNVKIIEASAEFLMARVILERENQKKKTQEAKQILSIAAMIFKAHQYMTKQLQCCLLLAECRARLAQSSEDIRQFMNYYQKHVNQKSNILGIHLKGKIIAESEWRICQQIWNKQLKNSQIKEIFIVDNHLKNALEESSRTEGAEFVYKIIEAQQKDNQILEKVNIRNNDEVTYIRMQKPNYKIGPSGCLLLSKAKWKNLLTLHLASNKIGTQGCRYLCEADWKQLMAIYLKSNNIDDESCQVLSHADWKNLAKMGLKKNKITIKGCRILSYGSWPKIRQLSLRIYVINQEQNKITPEQQNQVRDIFMKKYPQRKLKVSFE